MRYAAIFFRTLSMRRTPFGCAWPLPHISNSLVMSESLMDASKSWIFFPSTSMRSAKFSAVVSAAYAPELDSASRFSVTMSSNNVPPM